MRMPSLRRPRRFLPPVVALRIATLVAVVLALVLWRFIAPGSFLAALAPFARAGDALAKGAFSVRASFADRAKLADERDALAEQLLAVTRERDTLQATVDDLTAYRGALPALPKGVLTSVLLRPPASPYDSVVVETGPDARVVAGSLALAEGGTPAGIVTSVEGNFARVALFSAVGVRTNALAGAGRVPITLVGSGAGGFAFSLARAPRAALSQGDRVFFSYGGLVPIGAIARVNDNPESADISYLVSGTVNPFTLSWLTLVPYPSL